MTPEQIQKAMPHATPEEAKGMAAIIFLQLVNDVKESWSDAYLGWSRMKEADRQQTLQVYEMLKDITLETKEDIQQRAVR